MKRLLLKSFYFLRHGERRALPKSWSNHGHVGSGENRAREVLKEEEREVNHLEASGSDFRFSTKSSEIMASIRIVLFERKRKIVADKEQIFWNLRRLPGAPFHA